MRGDMNEWEQDRRGTERRTRLVSCRYPERRTGFDRRCNYPVLRTLQKSPWMLPTTLLLINALSVTDWMLTLRALKLGAVEGNAILASLIAVDPMLAAVFKIGATVAVTALFWTWRRYRLVLATALGGLAAYVALIAYHVGNLASLDALG